METAVPENWSSLAQCTTGWVRELRGLPRLQLEEQQEEVAGVPSSPPTTLLCGSADGTYPLPKINAIILLVKKH